MQARESGKAVLEPASARWPIFSVPNVLYVPETEFGFAESCCTKDHEFLARQITKKGCCTKDHGFRVRARVRGRDVDKMDNFPDHFPV